jgi:hypothetical protein
MTTRPFSLTRIRVSAFMCHTLALVTYCTSMSQDIQDDRWTYDWLDSAASHVPKTAGRGATGPFTLKTGSMVGIELGRVCFRRRVPTLTLSVARWVHNSAMATFSEAPLEFRTAEFPRSGLKPWCLVRKPSLLPRGSSAGTHTPRRQMVCSQLRFISCVRLRSALCPTTALKIEPPSAQSPFA